MPPAAKKNVEIVYPPVTRKKWIPPNQRPKEPRQPAYVKPKGINQPLKVSNLQKIWHRFFLFNGNRYVLAGSFSQTHKRFRLRTNGLQGSCNCIVACIMMRMCKMEFWNFNVLNQILCIGDCLYEKSLQKLKDKSVGELEVLQIHPSFYLYKYIVTFQVTNASDPTRLTSTFDQDQGGCLTKTLTEFFSSCSSCVVKTDQRHVALWRYDNAYFLFDPTEHQRDGEKWDGLPSNGFAICIRFTKIQTMANFIVADHAKGKTLRMTIWAVEMLKYQPLQLQPPESLDEVKKVNEEQEKIQEQAKGYQGKDGKKEVRDKKSKEPEIAQQKTLNAIEEMRAVEETSPDLEAESVATLATIKKVTEQTKLKTPIELNVAESVTYFTTLVEHRMGIIRAATHQGDKKFSRFRDGEQSLSQAVAALVQRRNAPTRKWTRKLVNDILKLGETIHHKSLKERRDPEEPFKISSIVKKIVHPPGTYALNYDELAVLGKLQSDKSDVLDLFPALMTILRTYDCCVINGPMVLAVWYEDDRYYMYDPNARDEMGGVTGEKGVACVIWFSALKELVDLYFANLPKNRRWDEFHLSKVIIEDYVGKPEKWHNFEGLVKDKWILRGTISQSSHIFSSDSRNTQCTANAVMSIVFVHVRSPQEWSKRTVDQVLMSGDDFYRSTVQRLIASNRLVSRLLMVDELNRSFSFSNKEVMFEINDCCVNGVLGYPDYGPVLNVKTGLAKFFESFDFGVLTCRNISVAVWRKDGAYYYFDSHSRDEKGVESGYGTACLLRLLSIDDLARSIEFNLRPDKLSYFNIGAVGVNFLEAEVEGGVVRQPLNHYKLIDADHENVAIVLSKTSNKDEKYEFNAGKQTVPQCVAAMGMNRLRASANWNNDILQTILDIGHKYFEDCMAAYESTNDQNDEDKGITSKNLVKQFSIGLNQIEVELELIAEGFVEDGLEQCINDYYTTNDSITDDDNLELLVETENITVSVWKDQNLFYLFDPSPRDDRGQVIGRDEWSEKIIPEITSEHNVDADTVGTAGEIAPPSKASVQIYPEEGAGDLGKEDSIIEEEIPKRPKSRGEGVFEPDDESVKDLDVNGKACVILFYQLADLIKHVVENTRPNRRSMMPFTVNKVRVKNSPIVKEIYDQDYGGRIDSYSGNWHNFVELDHGHWILRGQTDLNDPMFPEENRGKQERSTILAALAFAKLYSMSLMGSRHITSILCYGDRLLTFARRVRKEALARDESLNLLEEEIRAILANEHYDFEDYPRSFVIGDVKVNLEFTRKALDGDVKAKADDEVLDLKRGLDLLFTQTQFGVLECKGYLVGVWKGATVYYMFDPHKTGVTGVRSLIGYPSITRYLETDLLAKTYLQSLPKDGLNIFYIHEVTVTDRKYRRPKDVMKEPQKASKISGFTDVESGKTILRGSFSQEDPVFGKGEHVLSAPVAFVALTMSLVHKPQMWSKPIVDEVIVVANELFNQTLKDAGPSFDPWDTPMDPYVVSKDFNIGVMKANCQIRATDQRGLMEVLNSASSGVNLRQGLERFFAENTHGILYSPPGICYAIWEEETDGFPILYMYDPNKRGPTGLPYRYGTACVMTFASAKKAADHVLECCSGPEERRQPYTIIPVEITVGPHKTHKKRIKKEIKHVPEANQNMVKYLAHQALVEQKRIAKKKTLEQKKKTEAKKKFWETRTGYFEIPKGQAILRGTRCLTSSCYQDKTRGNQDIPTCIVAFVANCIVPISDWTWKEIDAVLDAGDQLYIDSYIAYSPRDKKLGLENVVRNIFIMNKKAHVTIYKPIVAFGFETKKLARNLDKWLLTENFCMLCYMEQWVCVFLKRGFYFLFDPHERNSDGCRSCPIASPCPTVCDRPCTDGAACLLRFERLDDLAAKLINNLLPIEAESGDAARGSYQMVLVRLEGGVCQCA